MHESLQSPLWFRKIIGSTLGGRAYLLHHGHGHNSHYTTLATLNHIELQFNDFGLGMRLFGKCPTLRESPKLPVLLINNSARTTIIPKNVVHYWAQRCTFDPFDVSSCGSVKWGRDTLMGGNVGGVTTWDPSSNRRGSLLLELPGHYIKFSLIHRITHIWIYC